MSDSTNPSYPRRRATITEVVRLPNGNTVTASFHGTCDRARDATGRFRSGAHVLTRDAGWPLPPVFVSPPVDWSLFRATVARTMAEALDNYRHRSNNNEVAAAEATLREVLRHVASTASDDAIAHQRDRVIALRDRLEPVWQDQLKDLDARLWPVHRTVGWRRPDDWQGHIDDAGLLRTLQAITAALLAEVVLCTGDKAAPCGVAAQTHADHCYAILERIARPLQLAHQQIRTEAEDSLSQLGQNGYWYLEQQRLSEERHRTLDAAARQVMDVVCVHAPLFDPKLLVRNGQAPIPAWATVLPYVYSIESPRDGVVARITGHSG